MNVDYIAHMGDDLMVANAARVSFDKASELEDGKLSQKDAKLLNYLAKHNHWTPFAHPQITLRETVPIFVARQRFKHVVGFVYNEVSRRYVDDEPTFFFPKTWRGRPEASIKQGSSDTEISMIQPGVPIDDVYAVSLAKVTHLYNDMLDAGVAPEQARMVLPQSMMTSYYVTGSLSAWARFYKQRTEHTAQSEIRDLADQVGEIIQPLYPVSWSVLTEPTS